MVVVITCAVHWGSLPFGSTNAFAQDAALASVPDSPTCHQLLLQAGLQAESNPQGAMRTLEQALKTPTALVPVDAESTLFRPVRSQAVALLARTPELLRAWGESMGPRAERVLEREGPLEAWRRFPGTPAAVQAGLLMARNAIANGAPAAASWRLEQVRADPAFDLGEEGAWLRLRAIAAWGEGDKVGAHAAADRLSEVVGATAAAELRERFLGSPAAAGVAGSPLDQAVECDASIIPSEPSWRVSLGDTPLERARRAAADRNDPQEDVDAQREAGVYRSMLPVESGGTILVSSGGAVSAFDALTHARTWTVGVTSQAFASTGDPAPLSMPAVSHGIAYSLLGPPQAPHRPRVLVAVDVEDGTIGWMAGLGSTVIDIDEEQSIPEAVGIPVPSDSVVAVQTRRVDARAQATAEVHAFEAGTGNTSWTTLLGTAAQIGATAREPTQLIAQGGTYLVPTTVGTYARLEAETGDILWLRRLPCPLRASSSRALPFELGTSAVYSGQWMALSPDRRSIVALDISSGTVLADVPTGPGTAAGPVRYLVSTEEGVLAVGRDVHLLDATLQRRVWSREDLVPAGRVVRARVGSVSALVIPRDGIVTIVNAATGSSIGERGAPAANVVAGGAGLAAATESELLAWVPTDNALDRLVRTMQDSPGNLAAACALLDLTVRLGDAALTSRSLALLCTAIPLNHDLSDGDALALAAAMTMVSTEPSLPDGQVGQFFEAIDQSSFPGELVARAGLLRAEWLARSGKSDAAAKALWSMIGDPRLERVMIPGGASESAEVAATAALTRAPIAAGALLAAIADSGAAPWPSATDPASRRWIERLQAEVRPAHPVDVSGDQSAGPSAAEFAESLREFVRLPCHPLPIEPAEAVEEVVLGWRPGALEAYSLDGGEMAWRVATAGTSRPSIYRLADRTLAVISVDSVVTVDPLTGAIRAQCRDLPAALAAADTVNLTIPRRPLAVVLHAAATADTVVIGNDRAMVCLGTDGTALVPRWRWSEPGATLLGLHHAEGTVWVIAQRPGPDGGLEGLVRAIDAGTGASRGQISGLPWTQARSATPVDADTLALTIGGRLLCIRSWSDALHVDWEVPGAAVSKASPSFTRLGGLLVPMGVTRMVARRSFDGHAAPLTADESGAGIDAVAWIPYPGGGLRWGGGAMESFSDEGQLSGTAAIPPDRVIRAATVRKGVAVAVLQDIASVPGLQVVQQPQRLEIAVFNLAAGLRWAGASLACPELESRLPPTRVVLGRRSIAVATQSGYLLAITGRAPSARATPAPAS